MTHQAIRLMATLRPVKWLIPSTEGPATAIHIASRTQIDGSVLYAIDRRSCVLSKEGDWEIEPMPSSRDEEFFKRCRYHSIEEACEYLAKYFPT